MREDNAGSFLSSLQDLGSVTPFNQVRSACRVKFDFKETRALQNIKSVTLPICFLRGPITVPTTFNVFPGDIEILSSEPFRCKTTVVTCNEMKLKIIFIFFELYNKVNIQNIK